MFGKRFVLFQLLGFKVQADSSWLFLVVLVTWSLAAGFFPAHYEGLSVAIYWWMGVIGAIGLFLSLILHELSHSIVARLYGLPIKGITLFIFGGVAEMEQEPPSAKIELLVAIAGPIASFVLAAGFGAMALLAEAQDTWTPAWGVMAYLSLINGVIAVFNLIPAFPLDGGRILRALLWYWKRDLRWATKIASRSGEVFGLILMSIGVLNILGASPIAGMWWFLIGLFLTMAARASYAQLLTRRAFEGEPISRFMTRDPITVSPDLSVQALVEDYIYRYHYDLFPVVKGTQLIGLTSARQIKRLPRADWSRARVADVVEPRSTENTINPDADAVKVLSIMQQNKRSRLLVVDGDRLVGIVALRDLLEFFNLKMDLERPD